MLTCKSASVTTTIRLIYSTKVDPNDFLYSTNIPFFWGVLELVTSISCTSLATLKPLLVKLKAFSWSSNHSQDRGYELGGSRIGGATGAAFPQKSLSRTSRKESDPENHHSSTEEIVWDGKWRQKSEDDGRKDQGTKVRIEKTMSFGTRSETKSLADGRRREVWEDRQSTWLETP